jgi:hypothetical protein
MKLRTHSALLVVVPIALFVVFAKLFRAAAQSETIHRELHKNAVVSLGEAFFANKVYRWFALVSPQYAISQAIDLFFAEQAKQPVYSDKALLMKKEK